MTFGRVKCYFMCKLSQLVTVTIHGQAGEMSQFQIFRFCTCVLKVATCIWNHQFTYNIFDSILSETQFQCGTARWLMLLLLLKIRLQHL